AVHIEDRGFQFADGVYEVIAVEGGAVLDLDRHLDRLGRSLGELRIPWPMSRAAMAQVIATTVGRNRVRLGIVYLQVTRGQAARAHAFPRHAVPTLVVTARSMRLSAAHLRETGVAVITVPDIRWRRCDIKSIGLLPNVLAKQQAVEAGAFESWFVDDSGYVTEGSSSNAWIVDKSGVLATRSLDSQVLPGITRAVLLEGCADAGIGIEQRAFTVAEALAAREAMVSSTIAFVLPVVSIDGARIGGGAPGPVFRALHTRYREHVESIARR
ncbi:MAG: D-amino-acid transaminase, partial [Proteobacteria bacterium]|nr:D-amino-acid transaminase [Pseudomonadota bacterium]